MMVLRFAEVLRPVPFFFFFFPPAAGFVFRAFFMAPC